MSFRLLVVSVFVALVTTGCGGSRPAVIGNGSQVADLWWSGELTDQKGNRWDIAILPGVGPSLALAGDSFSRSGKRFTEYGDPAYWQNVGNLSKDCFVFAGSDCLRDFVVSGIGEDYSDTTGTLGRLASEKPFGWIPQIIWRTLWGYAIKPIGRVALGPVGAVGGTAAGLLVPVGGVLYPPVVSTADVAVMGLVVPATRIVWQQPAWLFSLTNNEPDESTDGSWGLRIIARPPGWKPAVETRQSQPPEPPLSIDQERLRQLAQGLVRLEERLVRSQEEQQASFRRVNGLQTRDGQPTDFTLDPAALHWLDKDASIELELWRNQAQQRLGARGDRLPSTAELLRLLHEAVQTIPAIVEPDPAKIAPRLEPQP